MEVKNVNLRGILDGQIMGFEETPENRRLGTSVVDKVARIMVLEKITLGTDDIQRLEKIGICLTVGKCYSVYLLNEDGHTDEVHLDIKDSNVVYCYTRN